ncbi:MAG: ComEC/Rec2 family competence protein [Pseudomonadota bacterium]|nr:ComEC/Rec2 family competence protein [Pseudomonadota bacterium]
MPARLAALLAAERGRLMLWSPVGLMIGITIYFQLANEPPAWTGAALLMPAVLLLLLARRHWLRFLLWPLMLAALGFSVAQLRAHYVATPLLAEELPFRTVEGTIDEIDPVEERIKLVLSQPVIEDLPPEATPRRIRVSFRDDGESWRIGDRVRMQTTLYPLPHPVMPGSYDFARHFYFRSIGGNGFAVRPPEVIAPRTELGLKDSLNDLRHAIGEDMRAHMPGAVGTVAGAMTVGETGPIPEDIKNTLRDAGLAHMLAIAGLHLGIVAAIVFFTARLLLTLYPPLALRINAKKIAAVLALLSAGIYLSLAGFPIPAQRAFIKVAFLFMAVLLDRRGITLRTLSLAAAFILLVFPEAMLGASFQLSFAATLAIVAFYERFSHLRGSRQSWGGRVLHEALGITFTSLVATLATMPFILYNFNRFAAFGVIANMIVIPLATFIIMPGMVLSLLLMPLGWQAIGYAPLSFGTSLMIGMAGWVTNLPYASLRLPAPNDAGLALSAFGLLWLCLMRSRWRLAGIPLAALGVATMALHVPPDMLISYDGRQVMARLPDGHYTMLKGSGRSFTAQAWLRSEEQDELVPLRETDLDCDKELCHYGQDGRVLLVRKPQDDEALTAACTGKSDLLIAWRYVHTADCPGPAQLIDRDALERHGAHALWLQKSGIRLLTTFDRPGTRLWNPR